MKRFALLCVLLLSPLAQAHETARSPGKSVAPIQILTPGELRGQPGVEQTITLKLRGNVDDGRVALTLYPEPGLRLIGDSRAQLDIHADRDQEWTIRVTPESDGLFYLRLLATAKVQGKDQSRSLTLPISVGSGKKQKQMKVDGRIVRDASGRDVIEWPAQQ